jgi:hypothetical protein
LAPPTAKSGGKLRQIGRKLGVESAELPAGTQEDARKSVFLAYFYK